MRTDFSLQTISKAIRKELLQSPSFLYPLAFGILGIVSSLFFGITKVAQIIAVAGSSFAFLALAFNFLFRKGSFEKRYVESIRKKLIEKQLTMIKQLGNELERITVSTPELNDYLTQAKKQFKKVRAYRTSFHDILGSKLEDHELSALRYRGTIENVYLAVLDNLELLSGMMRTACSIDVDYIDEREKALHRKKTLEDADQKELTTLRERSAIYESQLKKINILLTDNEEALTKMARLSSQVSTLNAVDAHTVVSLENAIEELEDMNNRTERMKVSLQ